MLRGWGRAEIISISFLFFFNLFPCWLSATQSVTSNGHVTVDSVISSESPDVSIDTNNVANASLWSKSEWPRCRQACAGQDREWCVWVYLPFTAVFYSMASSPCLKAAVLSVWPQLFVFQQKLAGWKRRRPVFCLPPSIHKWTRTGSFHSWRAASWQRCGRH